MPVHLFAHGQRRGRSVVAETPAPPPSRTFRIFVSSTFSDMIAERSALQERVFPRLRALCEAHGCRFQAIDLRWGVSEEAALDQQTMRICLSEIQRCQEITPRPNFIVLLGDRYGWKPLPWEIPAEEMARMVSEMTPEARALALWDETSDHADETAAERSSWLEGVVTGGSGWYRLDTTSVPPVYVLQRRPANSCFADGHCWQRSVEQPLHTILERAASQAALPPEALLKYTASATHQEIVAGALAVLDGHSHAFAFLRHITNLDMVSRPMKEVDSRPSWATPLADFVDFDTENPTVITPIEHLTELQDQLRCRLPGNVREYETTWTPNGLNLDHLEQFCRDVEQQLSAVITAQIAALEVADSLSLEIHAHRSFGELRGGFVVGREDQLGAISHYLQHPAKRPLALSGPPGSGKTALMARAAMEAGKQHPQAVIVVRYIGQTPDSADCRTLLEMLCLEISQAYRANTADLPLEYRDLVQELPKRLALATPDRPLIVFLDALDQLSEADSAADLVWLPNRLAPNVWLVVSVLSGDPLEAARHRLVQSVKEVTSDAPPFLDLPGLSSGSGEEILDTWCREARRSPTAEQRSDILTGFVADGGHPLYLKLAFEESRRWHSFDDPFGGYDGHTALPTNSRGLITHLLQRLERPEGHGQALVSRGLGYLAAARHGLTEEELLDLLSEDQEVMQDLRARSPLSPTAARLPVVVWSRLYAELEPYLEEQRGDGTILLGFCHRLFEEAVLARYLAGAAATQRHRTLAAYFDRQPLEKVTSAAGLPNLRKVSEQPYQQTRAGLWADLERTLCDLNFVQAKCAAGLTYDLVQDYPVDARQARQETRAAKYSGPAQQSMRLRAYRSFVAAHAYIFARDAAQILPFAYNYAASGPVCEEARAAAANQWSGHPWIELSDRPPLVTDPALLRTLQGHEGEVTCVALTADGQLCVSGSDDGTLRAWDTATGICQQVIHAHRDGVNGVALNGDGSIAVSAGVDGLIGVWDVTGGSQLFSLAGHDGEALSVAITPDGSHGVSGGADGTVRLWDLVQGGEPRVLEGHFGEVNSVAITPDGSTIVSGGSDWQIRLWDAESGSIRRCLMGNVVPVQGVDIDAKGLLVGSSSGQPADAGGIVPAGLLYGSEVRFWDTQSDWVSVNKGHVLGERGGRALGTLNTIIHDIALTPDGNRAVSGGFDKALCVWDVESSKIWYAGSVEHKKLHGHLAPVLSVAVDRSGQIAITGGADRTVRVWWLAGNAPQLLPLARRIGRIGAKARATFEEHGALIWKNDRIRRNLLAPLLSIVIGFATADWITRVAAVAGMPTPGVWSITTTIACVWMFWQTVEWRVKLKSDPHVWKSAVLPRPVRLFLCLLLLPLYVVFPVYNCPLCGSSMSGRRFVFHCPACGFRDRA